MLVDLVNGKNQWGLGWLGAYTDDQIISGAATLPYTNDILPSQLVNDQPQMVIPKQVSAGSILAYMIGLGADSPDVGTQRNGWTWDGSMWNSPYATPVVVNQAPVNVIPVPTSTPTVSTPTVSTTPSTQMATNWFGGSTNVFGFVVPNMLFVYGGIGIIGLAILKGRKE